MTLPAPLRSHAASRLGFARALTATPSRAWLGGAALLGAALIGGCAESRPPSASPVRAVEEAAEEAPDADPFVPPDPEPSTPAEAPATEKDDSREKRP